MKDNVKPKSLILIEKLDKGEEVLCPACNQGMWHRILSKNGKGVIYKCDHCGKSIVPRVHPDYE